MSEKYDRTVSVKNNFLYLGTCFIANLAITPPSILKISIDSDHLNVTKNEKEKLYSTIRIYYGILFNF